MKSDIQIAQEAVMEPIAEVAKRLDIREDELELYGKYKAKFSDELLERLKDEPDGKLVYCSRPAEETGALAVWKRAVCGRIIVTPGWCRDRCKLHGGPGHL